MINIPVIIYHSIAPEKNKSWYKSFLTFELKYFEDYVRYLHKKNYTFLFLDEYFEIKKKQNSKGKYVCLTFDDGYLDNYVFAYPVLKKYKAKGTIFVNPEFVPKENLVRDTVESVWEGNKNLDQLETLGFISWEEMSLMERSGVIDIQSHTLTHTKYFCSDKIIEYHNPNSDYLYPISNEYPDKKPYYMTDPGFKKLLKYGTPFFEKKSALITKRVQINKEFSEKCGEILSNTDWHNYNYSDCKLKTDKLYNEFKSRNNLIVHIETEEEYKSRVTHELITSKNILEKELSKKINYCCWPHGDYNDFVHKTAMETGYKASTVVINPGEDNNNRDRFDRTGSGVVLNNRYLTLLKAKYKLQSYRERFPYYQINNLYYKLKYGQY